MKTSYSRPLSLLAAAGSFFAQTFKISYIIGSYAAFFSLRHCIAPLVGLYGGVKASAKLFLIHIVASTIRGSLPGIPLVYHLPSFCGALYLSLHKHLAALIALMCMLLFIVHPEGGKAWEYSLYWLIPTIALIFKQNFFLQALGSTFVAHAVGSVCTLYTKPLLASAWISLIPIVAVERFFMALGITIFHHLFSASAHWWLARSAAKTTPTKTAAELS